MSIAWILILVGHPTNCFCPVPGPFGTTALDLRELDPYFVEICRRVRLLADDGRIVAWTSRSTAPRVAAKDAHGNLGDFWTPVAAKDAKALSLSSMGFRYDRLAKLILNRDAFALPPAMRVGSTRTGRWRVVAPARRARGRAEPFLYASGFAVEPRRARTAPTVGCSFALGLTAAGARVMHRRPRVPPVA